MRTGRAATPRCTHRDSRHVVPLLDGVDYYFAAASMGKNQFDPMGHLLGDLLVRADSAVGLHRDELKRLDIKPEHCRVFHEKNHFDLLDDPTRCTSRVGSTLVHALARRPQARKPRWTLLS